MNLLPKKVQDDRLPIMCTRKEAYTIVERLSSETRLRSPWKRFVDFVVHHTR